MARRPQLLELAILGLLHEGPMHGYELRKRLNLALGAFRALSYGTLYPALRRLVSRGMIREAGPATVVGASRRQRIAYEITDVGIDRFQELASRVDTASYEDDDSFDVHFAFFARTEAPARLRILEGRRARLEEQLARVRSVEREGRGDSYTAALTRHSLQRIEADIRWLSDLIAAEREPHAGQTPGPLPSGGTRHTP
ncbi:MAG: PadR family transcriptional regulator [Micrococcales bacterium]|nr:PadR family transcriptional regulator [Micrococcales bacterium]